MTVDYSEIWRVYQTAEETLDDSDKTFTVPPNTEWQLLWLWVEFTSSVAVGNRQLVVQVYDASNDLLATLARASVVQAASLTRYYLFAPGVSDLLGFRDTDYLTTPIPVTSFLDAGQYLRVWDNKAIAAAADHMIIQMQWAGRAVVQ